MRVSCSASVLLGSALLLFGLPAAAQNGVDDNRVSLPEGPGSLEGIGDDVEFDPNMGTMTYAIPIRLPRGFPGASPSLGLSYNSGGGSGPVGIGWSMGLPAVGRMTVRGAPDYDVDDLFDVSGAELVQVGSDAGDLVYRARFEQGFARYRWVAAGAGEEGYWIGENPDGSRSYFGAEPDGTLVPSARRTRPQGGTAEYNLVATVDAYGHRVSYAYATLDGTVPLLTQITWLADGANDVYAVDIEYEARPDALSDASRGYEERIDNRVRAVVVKNGSNVIRSYVLGYEDDVRAGGFSRLAEVRQYGVGGRAGGALYPSIQTFGYSQALGVECAGADCDQPYLVDMGVLPGAVSLGNGFASLIDIDADGLPDIIDTTDVGPHRFYRNVLTANPDGTFAQSFASARASTLGTGGSFRLGGTGEVQIFDVNGDGKSDLLDTNSGVWLENGGAGDWASQGNLSDATSIRGVDFAAVRFVDIDDDKRVDFLTSTSQTTTLYHNDGTAFSVDTTIMPIGAAFGQGSNLQFADMNGDGLNDPVEIRQDGTVRYRLNLGQGMWSTEGNGDWRVITGLSINAADLPRTDLEDINGDGIADIVIVGQTSLQYALNRNGDRFDGFVPVTSNDITGDLPERAQGTRVLYADMNGNGSSDVVWFLPNGQVVFLELFPRRPNLLTRVDNGIGSVQRIRYTTAAEEAARAEAAGDPWTHRLQIPMQLVATVDRFVTLTGSEDGSGLHEVTAVSYRDGYYDGDERQYRGFERVETVISADASMETSRSLLRFDVGRGAPHRNGLRLGSTVMSEDRVLQDITMVYGDCTVAEVPTPAQLEAQGRRGVYFPCLESVETVHQEGRIPAEWKTVREEMTYDGYGNVARMSELGVIGEMGDELFTETTYVTPSARWLIGLPATVQVYADAAKADFTETQTFYDGEDFMGLPLGQATEGFVSRVTEKIDSAGNTLTALRARHDAHGNSVETIDPLGTIADATTHRRSYTYDSTGLFLLQTELHNVDEAGQPYRLRRESLFERSFQRLSQATQWMLVRDGQVETNRDAYSYNYDAFGRKSEEFMPGDALDAPTKVYDYELGSDVTRIRVRVRSQAGGPLDEEAFDCLDGKGRVYQSRTRIADGEYQVSGFTTFNARGLPVEIWQPFTSPTGACDFTVPSVVKSNQLRYDGIGRLISLTRPGEGVHGAPVVERTEYLPLAEAEYDGEDTAAGGAHENTPLVTTFDGLSRTVAIERTMLAGGSVVRSGQRLFYDATGTFSGYEDAEGHRHLIGTDLLGRTVSVTDPSFGTVSYELDDASNVTKVTDARGVVQRRAYDGQNRISARWDEANDAATRVTWSYDVLPADCPRTSCTALPGEVATVRYPVAMLDGAVYAGADRFGYDVRRRPVFEARALEGLVSLETRTGYDNVGRVVSTTTPDGTVVTKAYDGASRVVSIDGFVSRIDYEPRDFASRIAYSNGAVTEIQYDDLLRVSALTHRDAAGGVINDLSITRNRADLVTAIADASATDVRHSTQLRLDDWYRITAADREDGSETFELDALDRIVAANDKTFTYDASRPLAVAAAGELSYGYDAAGQVVTRGAATYERDELGRIARILDAAGVTTGHHAYAADERVVQAAADGTLVIYAHDRFEVRDGIGATFVSFGDNRIAKQERTDLGVQIYGDGNGDGRVDAGDAWLARDATGSGITTAQRLAAAAARLLVEAETPKTYFHHDHIGSLIAATDDGGAVRGQQAFLMHGGLRTRTGFVSHYGFTGQEQDRSTGLLHMKFRELDPVSGRWDRFDPLFVGLGVDAMSSLGEASTGYAYVANNPGTGRDPSGLCDDCPKPKKKGKGGGGLAPVINKNSPKSSIADAIDSALSPSGPKFKPVGGKPAKSQLEESAKNERKANYKKLRKADASMYKANFKAKKKKVTDKVERKQRRVNFLKYKIKHPPKQKGPAPKPIKFRGIMGDVIGDWNSQYKLQKSVELIKATEELIKAQTDLNNFSFLDQQN